VFTVGFVIIIFAIVRLVEVTQATAAVQQDPTRIAESPIKLSAWSFIEGSVSIIVASLPTFRFLHRGGSTRKSSNNKSPYDRPRDIGKSLHTIGSARGPGKRSHPDDSLFETLVDDDRYDAKEMNTLSSRTDIGVAKPYDNGGITKQTQFSVREEISDEDLHLQRPPRAQHQRLSHTDAYQSRLRRDSTLVIQSNAV
jgi:hypothetical protein